MAGQCRAGGLLFVGDGDVCRVFTCCAERLSTGLLVPAAAEIDPRFQEPGWLWAGAWAKDVFASCMPTSWVRWSKLTGAMQNSDRGQRAC